MEGWKYYEGKKVYIILKNQRKYSGEVLEVEQGEILCWITIKDKFGARISFSTEEIELMEEER